MTVQVNIAALMESTSEPMKIQISQTTQEFHISLKMITDKFRMNVNLEDTFKFQELLQELGGFKTEIRGQMQVPRIGQVQLWNILLISQVHIQLCFFVSFFASSICFDMVAATNIL